MHILRLLLLACALASPAFASETPRQLAWDDLKVRVSLNENPTEKLTQEQLDALAQVLYVRNLKANGAKLTAQDITTERAAVQTLKQQWGIDADALLAKRQEFIRRVREADSTVNPALDGKLVRIPGYVLPLEFSGKQVTEFLLVPWVGACIHTPPPAPNQIVHVKTDKPVEVRGTFDAVWVTGKIAANASRKSLFLADGTADIDVGYSISADQVQPHK